MLTFTLADAEGDLVDRVEIYLVPATSPDCTSSDCATAADRVLLSLDQPNPIVNASTVSDTGRGPRTYTRSWEFAAQLPTQGALSTPYRVLVVLPAFRRCACSDPVRVGNDRPVIESTVVPTTEEVVGIAAVGFMVSDSSSDAVSIFVEYEDPARGWRPATPAGTPLDPEMYAIVGVNAPPHPGQMLFFFWNVVADLPAQEMSVRMRFSAADRDDRQVRVKGTPLETAPFRVDNNAVPAAGLQTGSFLANPDRRRGIPIPFEVRDPEGDAVDVIFQWRRESQSFDRDLRLPTHADDLRVLLRDPAFRKQKQICTELPIAFEGVVAPPPPSIDGIGSRVRLPELASTAFSLVAEGIDERELQILRGFQDPRPVASDWSTNPLVEPVVALPRGQGDAALLLDRTIPEGWRLLEVSLATGEVVNIVAVSSNARADAMTDEPGGNSVLIAEDTDGLWAVLRVSIADGSKVLLASADDSTVRGPVRGIASVGRTAALITVGDSLLRIDFTTTPGTVHTVLNGLATPWGVVVDPLKVNRIYLAERDFAGKNQVGRILAIDTDTLASTVVVTREQGVSGAGLPRPESLALERSGTRLLATTDRTPGDGERDLRGVGLGDAEDGEVFEIACYKLSVDSPDRDGLGGLTTGPDGLRILALPTTADLAVGGGIEQSRRIERYENSQTQTVRVTEPFAPPLSAPNRWRIRAPLKPLPAASDGTRGIFVWDSSDVLGGGNVFVRATPLDADVGTTSETDVGKLLVSPLRDSRTTHVGNPSLTDSPLAFAIADLNGDGKLDFVVANHLGNNLRVFYQEEAGLFQPDPIPVGDSHTLLPTSVVAADLNGDEKPDLVVANGCSDNRCTGAPCGNNVQVFFQDDAATYTQAPLLLGDPNTLGPASVVAADLDGDGKLDLAVANICGGNVQVFFQDPDRPGTFVPNPLQLEDPVTTTEPVSVAAADLNGDSKLDIVVADKLGGDLRIFIQEGYREFCLDCPNGPHGDSTTGSPQFVAATDLDGDGLTDLISANFGSSDVSIFYQSADGTFSPTPDAVLGNPSTTPGAYSVAIADIDGDGDVDLVVSSAASSSLMIFYQDARREFAADPSGAIGDSLALSEPILVVARDLDVDGMVDLVVANRSGDNLVAVFQARAGEFTSSLDIAVSDAQASRMPAALAPADVDGDGDLDLVVASQLAGDVTIVFQELPGTFAPGIVPVGDPDPNSTPMSVLAADLDGDRSLDLVVDNLRGDNLRLFFQDPDHPGSFPASLSAPVGDPNTNSLGSTVAVGDLDGDGRLDLVVANQTAIADNKLRVFYQDPNHPRSFPADLSASLGDPSLVGPTSVVAADLDGDGRLDLAVADRTGKKVRILIQDPNDPRRFPPESRVSFGDSNTTDDPVAIAAADLNGDGQQDLVVVNESASTLTVFFQDAHDPERFRTSRSTRLADARTLAGPVAVTIADVDADGDDDLVSANRMGSNLTIFLQVSPGRFHLDSGGPYGDRTTTRTPQAVAVADLDGDGDVDLISANFVGESLAIFFGAH